MEAKGFMKPTVKTEKRYYNYSSMEKPRTQNESEECYGRFVLARYMRASLTYMQRNNVNDQNYCDVALL